jgi:hypothetical protein
MELVVRDPTYTRPTAFGFFARLGLRLIRDPRDLPFLRLILLLSATVVPTGVILFVPGLFQWWLAGVHVALVVFFLGPFVLMLHNTSHRKLFTRSAGFLNHYIPWVLGPFFGESPETYFAHHVGMHHAENNLEGDISTTLPYRRDSAFDFARYFLRFLFGVLFELVRYFVRKRRRALLVRTLVGEFLFVAALIGLSFYEWRAALAVVIVPFVITRFGMMAGNWAQHAFVDEKSPENNYRNSITCINTGYNRRCFNDGYHIGHHLQQTMHWTDMPVEFQKNLATYASEGAIVFRGLDYFGVWLALMLKRYGWLAKRVVQLGDQPKSEEDIVLLLRERTRWTRKRGQEDKPAFAQAPSPRTDATSQA